MPKMFADYNEPALSVKILADLLKAFNLHEQLETFEIIPTPESDHKNVSPVVIAGSTLGFHSWAIPHVLPYAHGQVVTRAVDKNIVTLSACLLAINLLHPEMKTSWNRRRELVQSKKISNAQEMRISRMALTALPKCNEVLSYRRWLFTHEFPSDRFDNIIMLQNELELLDDIADRYQANYHAWSHRKWCLSVKASVPKNCLRTRRVTEFTEANLINLFRTTNLQIYCTELEKNSNFIVSHISDYCGMHFRSFLLEQVFLILRNCEIDLNATATWTDQDHAEHFYNFVVSEILTQVGTINDQMKEPLLTEYVENLREKLSLFAVEAAFLLHSLSKNSELIEFYPAHEALWCFRKFLLYKFKACVHESQSVVAGLIFNGITNAEKRLVKLSSILIREPADARILKNYCNFVKRVLKIDLDY